MRDPFALSPDERAVRDLARDFAQRRLGSTVAARDEEERYDRSLFTAMGELGLAGVPIPERHGGAGMPYFNWILVMEELGAADMGMAVSMSVHTLAQLPILEHGSDQLRDRLLPEMSAGRWLGAFALTEPGSGSDAGALALRARLDGDTYRLDGTKVWITNGGEAEVNLVFATVDRALGQAGTVALVVEAEAPGFSIGSHERKMGIRDTISAELVFADAQVPVANRLGDQGEGLKIALGALASGRISIAAACVGLARSALEHAARHASTRRQFGRPIGDQQMVQAMLADAATAVDAARLLTWRAARLRDAGQPIAQASSMAKLFASDAAMKVATDAVQIFGGAGYSRDNPVERLMRDAKGAQIYEGTNQIQRLVIAREVLSEATRA